MTARDFCNYIIVTAKENYKITNIAPVKYGNKVTFTKFIRGTHMCDTSTYVSYDALNKTCGDIARFITKHNLENYAFLSPVRSWRVVNITDITIDSIKEEVSFR